MDSKGHDSAAAVAGAGLLPTEASGGISGGLPSGAIPAMRTLPLRSACGGTVWGMVYDSRIRRWVKLLISLSHYIARSNSEYRSVKAHLSPPMPS